ncbi:MAG: tetratricopeptide repeat protein, partial [Acidobacteria bacterium]|nr:tetratricopeptide repeat protein [Acidobacteriota bacterium]
TAGYVAPEQIRMEEPAPTSDLFAMGVILHEMIGGANPFARASSMETLAAILDEEPVPLRHAAADVPAAIDHIVGRCLEKNPEERFQSARDLAYQLRDVAGEAPAAGPRPARALRPAFIAAFATLIVALGAVLYLSDPHSLALGGASATQGVTTLAILPLVNSTGDPSLDYLADGITESLINQLSELPNLRVTARPTAFQFKGEQTDPHEVGKRLDVGAIATGRIGLQGGTLTVQADLIDTRSGAQMWGATFDAAGRKTPSLPGLVARDIARELEVKLSRAQRTRIELAPTVDSRAFDLYLKGRDALNTETPEGQERAIALLNQAIEADPQFARAHAALAEAYVRYSTKAEPRPMLARAREASGRALAIDPDLAEAHLARGIVLFWADWDFAGAEKEFKRALELNPSLAAANAYYSDLLECIGNFDEAIKQAQRSRALDPLSRRSAMSLTAAYFYAEEYEKARAELDRLLRTDPDYPNAHVMMGRVFHVSGDGARACRAYVLWDELRGRPRSEVEALRAACARGGVEGYNRELIRTMIADPLADPFMIAGLYAELDERDEALRFLRIAYERRATNMIYLRSDPAFESLRSNPEFVSLVRKVGFPPTRARRAVAGGR